MSRKNLIPLLRENPTTLRELALQVKAKPDEVEDDLVHLNRSLIHTEWEMFVHPAQCRKCGFEFGPEKLRKPSRCPECRATWLAEPMIEIRSRNK